MPLDMRPPRNVNLVPAPLLSPADDGLLNFRQHAHRLGSRERVGNHGFQVVYGVGHRMALEVRETDLRTGAALGIGSERIGVGASPIGRPMRNRCGLVDCNALSAARA
ncbi:MAG: hypothetical protein RL254_1225 [Planctomycetota bacterium]